MVVHRSNVNWIVPFVAESTELRPSIEENADRLDMAVTAGMVQWRPPIGIGGVDICFLGKNHLQHVRRLGLMGVRDGVVDWRNPIDRGLSVH
jgi:hypothetical protein